MSSKPYCQVLREGHMWRRADLCRSKRAKGSLPGGIFYRLQLSKDGLRKGVQTEVPSGARACMECAMEHFGACNI